MPLLTDLLADFEQSLRRRDLSPNTVAAYHWALNDLIVKAMRPPRLHAVADLTREVLEEWQDSQIERGWSARSRGLATTAARQLIKFGVDDDRYALDPKLERSLARVKQPDGTPHPIPDADLKKLRAYFLASPNLRERAFFFCLLNSGARIAEALRMRVGDYSNPTVIQKGGSTKVLRTPPSVVAMIAEYVATRSDGDHRLWGEMTPSDARSIWKRVTTELRIPYFTTHALRHTCATLLLAAGFSELAIAEWLGHHGTATVHNYAKVLDAQRQDMLDAMERLMQLPPPELKE